MRVLWLSLFVILVDQATKVAVLNMMFRGQSIPIVGDWLRFTFTENPGMAFGLTFGPPGTITVLALLATILVAVYVWQVRHSDVFYRSSLAMIFGGAIGNLVDRIFYGVIVDDGAFFMGHVVDFIHVSVWQGFVPEWVPYLGGAYVDLFPIWNVADMAIVAGVTGVLFFHERFRQQELARHRAETENGQPGSPLVDDPSPSTDASRADESVSEEMDRDEDLDANLDADLDADLDAEPGEEPPYSVLEDADDDAKSSS